MLTIINFLFNPVVWYVFGGLAVAVIVTILCFKYETARWITGTVFCLALLVSVGFSIYSLNEYYSAEGGIYGYVNGLLHHNSVEVSNGLNFKLSEIRLTSTTNENEFSADFDVEKSYTLDQKTNYGLLVNDFPISNVNCTATSIKGEYNRNFYDDRDNLILNDTLFITISFSAKGTHITLRTEGGGEALKYWNLFFNKDEFKIQINSKGYVNS